MIEGVILTKLKTIPGELGDVMHAMKSNEPSFRGFGEAYFSFIKKDAVKAWKRHKKMTLNIVVPCGKIKFVIYDDRKNSKTKGELYEVVISKDNYQRLTIPPMVWFGFQGLGDENLLLNITDIQHDPAEVESIESHDSNIPYTWRG